MAASSSSSPSLWQSISHQVQDAVCSLAREHAKKEQKREQRERIFLDHNGTTPLDLELYRELSPLQDACNPSSTHSSCGQKSQGIVRQAREKMRELCCCPPDRQDCVIFTSGSTESMNSLLRSTARHFVETNPGTRLPEGGYAGGGLAVKIGVIVTSPAEHKCVMETARQLAESSEGRIQWAQVPCNERGEVPPDELRDFLQSLKRVGKTPFLVSIIAANNELGTVQDVAGQAAVCAEQEVFFCPDTTQYAKCFPLDMSLPGLSSVCVSAHKIHGPKQAGCVVVHEDFPWHAQHTGGPQENGMRAGTESVFNIVFTTACLEKVQQDRAQKNKALEKKRKLFLQALHDALPEQADVQVLGNTREPGTYLPGTCLLFFNMEGFCNQKMAQCLDRRRVVASVGSACNTSNAKPSHVLSAIGFQKGEFGKVMRFSFGEQTTEKELRRAAHIIARCAVRASSSQTEE